MGISGIVPRLALAPERPTCRSKHYKILDRFFIAIYQQIPQNTIKLANTCLEFTITCNYGVRWHSGQFDLKSQLYSTDGLFLCIIKIPSMVKGDHPGSFLQIDISPSAIAMSIDMKN